MDDEMEFADREATRAHELHLAKIVATAIVLSLSIVAATMYRGCAGDIEAEEELKQCRRELVECGKDK